MASRKPPIIYLNCHDAGRLIQPHGCGVLTPRLQEFAEESIFFRQAHCVAPTCSPSRAALLSGKYPHQVGMLGLAHRGFEMADYSDHLVQRLGREGYRTALCGQQHVAPGGRENELIGYTDNLTLKANERVGLGMAGVDQVSAERAVRFIEAQDKDASFYLECGFFYPHRPYPDGALDRLGKTVAPPTYLPNTPETRRDMAGYQAAMGLTDDCFGIVLDALRKSEWFDRAIIVVTTDHGPAFPWAKCNLNDQGTGVMLMMRLPGQQHAVDSDSMVTHLDIMPTIANVLGWDDEFEGRSLLPVLGKSDFQFHREIFSEVTYHASYEPMRSIRTNQFRYVRRFDTNWNHPVLPNVDDGPSKTVLMNAGLRDLNMESEALYDLVMDPAERRNLVGNPDYSQELNELCEGLYAWMKRTDDPLLVDSVPLPPGATATPISALSYLNE